MAERAIRAESAAVVIILLMTGVTCGRRSLEFKIGMAFVAGDINVRTGQLENGPGVVECGRRPTGRRMAGGTVRAEQTAVRIVLEMTRSAVRGRAFEDSVDMAALTSHSGMFAVQVEGELRVVHGCQVPAIRHMARTTVRTELSVVMVIL